MTNPAWTEYDVNDKYTWAKAPRYKGKPMEAGPLVAHARRVPPRRRAGQGDRRPALAKLGAAGKPEVLVSLLGRVAARNLETAVVAQWSVEWVNELVAAVKGGSVSFFEGKEPSQGSGAGLWEAPRGAVGHWMTIEGGRISQLPDLHAVHLEHRWTRR